MPGSELTTRWYREKLRPAIFRRDNGICAICGKPIDPALKSPHPGSFEVHHTRGRATGTDPRFLVASHRVCNGKVGNPNRTGDPKPKVVTKW
jgi:5-methylcytosine-specific restriction endonuclease McrA